MATYTSANTSKLRTLHLFAGVGAVELGLKPWLKTVAYSELDPDAIGVLEYNMARGRLDRAPVVPDVRDVDGREYRGKVDMVFTSAPCQDLSRIGKMAGLRVGKRSNLFLEGLRVVDEAECDVVFSENVPPLIQEHLHVLVNELVDKRGFDLIWGIVAASQVGAPHMRRRAWVLATRRAGLKHRAFDNRSYRWPSFSHPPERMKLVAGPGDSQMLELLGNSLVPSAARLAFLYLVSGARVLSRKEANRVVRYEAPSLCGITGKSWRQLRAAEQTIPPFGYISHKESHLLYPLPPLTEPYSTYPITLDPNLLPPPHEKYKLQTQPRLFRPVQLERLSTPRHSNTHPARVLTARCKGDLPTQIRFARGTKHRRGRINPAFVAWMMGIPPAHLRWGAKKVAGPGADSKDQRVQCTKPCATPSVARSRRMPTTAGK